MARSMQTSSSPCARTNQGATTNSHQVFVVETKGLHLKNSSDTAYKRCVFNICSEHAAKKDWADFVPAMRQTVVKFEIVDEDEWEKRLNALLVA